MDVDRDVGVALGDDHEQRVHVDGRERRDEVASIVGGVVALPDDLGEVGTPGQEHVDRAALGEGLPPRVDLDDDRDRCPGHEQVRLVGEVDRDVSLHVGVVDLGGHARAPCDFVETTLRTFGPLSISRLHLV